MCARPVDNQQFAPQRHSSDRLHSRYTNTSHSTTSANSREPGKHRITTDLLTANRRVNKRAMSRHGGQRRLEDSTLTITGVLHTPMNDQVDEVTKENPMICRREF